MNIEKIIREELLNMNEWDFIRELTILTEEETNDRSFRWDIVKEKIDITKKNVKTEKQAEQYLNTFLGKVTEIPKQLKVKMVRYVIMGLAGLLSISSITKNVEINTPDIKQEVLMGMVSSTIDATSINIPKKAVVVTPSGVSDTLIDFLKREEGSPKHKGKPILTAYSIGDGMVTIGWGHAERTKNSKYSKGQKINKRKAEELLEIDITEAEDGLNRLLGRWDDKGVEYTINQGMYDAMVSMIFNMGLTNFLRSDFIQLVKKGEYKKAEELIAKTHITYPGHVRRRKKESKMFGSILREGLENDFDDFFITEEEGFNGQYVFDPPITKKEWADKVLPELDKFYVEEVESRKDWTTPPKPKGIHWCCNGNIRPTDIPSNFNYATEIFSVVIGKDNMLRTMSNPHWDYDRWFDHVVEQKHKGVPIHNGRLIFGFEEPPKINNGGVKTLFESEGFLDSTEEDWEWTEGSSTLPLSHVPYEDRMYQTVMISNDSEYYEDGRNGDASNPIDVEGIIYELSGDEDYEDGHHYIVDWSSGVTNSYNMKDLVIFIK